MPFENIWERNGIRMHFSGEMSPSDILNANLDFYGDHRSDTARYQILDTLDVTSLADDMPGYASVMEILAGMDAAASLSVGNLMVALVSTHEGAIDLFKTYAGISEEIQSGWRTGIFHDMAAARRWIAAGGAAPG